ncbi:branched-chain amino acid transport system II carrier protein [Alkaliphilus sp. MSJ-5]|uniref:Branched-chain amino acid transport system carrier protein n=2 Tax=Alkaliphilus flagellatus TaxID=2841507 RepID=A0ABS6G7D4_9FIRM|nr:branched-chain amino acid transport system II carrier protein [Alkaliphilus flagellatus]
MMNNKRQDILVVGFALFAMFFGAGNLIFPPSLGQQTGTQVISSIVGFLLTGVGLPLVGIIAVAKFGGNLEVLGSRVNQSFGVVITIIVTLAIGPFLAIPRTSATTFEMGILPFFPNMNSVVFSIIYFAIVLFFVLRPSSLIDNIGKILTPALFVTLLVIIIKGIISPIGTIGASQIATPFATGFKEGYQTMDALASTVLGSIIVGSIMAKGYKNPRDVSSLTIKAGIVATIGLGVIYGGLAYLGATATSFPSDISRAQLIIGITESILGNVGKILLGIAVGLACLTTSIGLTAATGEYFSKLTKNKLSYKLVCILTAIISMVISNAGVDEITSLAEPLLVVLYPVVIALIMVTFLDKYIQHKAIYSGVVYTALVVSVLEVLVGYNVAIPGAKKVLAALPLADQGFAWVVPTIVVGILLMVFFKASELLSGQAYTEK